MICLARNDGAYFIRCDANVASVTPHGLTRAIRSFHFYFHCLLLRLNNLCAFLKTRNLGATIVGLVPALFLGAGQNQLGRRNISAFALAAVKRKEDRSSTFLTPHTKIRSDIRFWPVRYVHDFIDLRNQKLASKR